MGRRNGKDPTVWMVAIQPHTDDGKLINVGEPYLVHEEMVETIERVLKFAVRDTPPKKAVRPKGQ